MASAQQAGGVLVVSSCGGQSLNAGTPGIQTVDTTGKLCTNAASGGSTTISGPLGPTTAPSAAVATTDTGTPITGQSLSAGGQGVTGWLSQLYAAVNSSIAAGSAIIGKVGIDQTTPGTTHAVQMIPGATGGLTVYFVQPTASDNHANIVNGAHQVYHIKATNNQATINYLRLYNAGTGFSGCNSATNLVDQWAIPGNTGAAGFVEDIAMGEAFSTGISICVTSGYGTNDTTNATASAMSVSIGYK